MVDLQTTQSSILIGSGLGFPTDRALASLKLVHLLVAVERDPESSLDRSGVDLVSRLLQVCLAPLLPVLRSARIAPLRAPIPRIPRAPLATSAQDRRDRGPGPNGWLYEARLLNVRIVRHGGLLGADQPTSSTYWRGTTGSARARIPRRRPSPDRCPLRRPCPGTTWRPRCSCPRAGSNRVQPAPRGR